MWLPREWQRWFLVFKSNTSAEESLSALYKDLGQTHESKDKLLMFSKTFKIIIIPVIIVFLTAFYFS